MMETCNVVLTFAYVDELPWCNHSSTFFCFSKKWGNLGFFWNFNFLEALRFFIIVTLEAAQLESQIRVTAVPKNLRRGRIVQSSEGNLELKYFYALICRFRACSHWMLLVLHSNFDLFLHRQPCGIFHGKE